MSMTTIVRFLGIILDAHIIICITHTNTRRHVKIEYHNHSHQIHQQPKSPNTTFLLKSSYSTSDHHGQTSTITDSIMNFVQSDEAQATIDSKLKLFAFATKSMNITAKYTQTDRKKTKRSDTQ
jgi:hypothetical protein